MNDGLEDRLSAWFDDADAKHIGEIKTTVSEASESVAESLLIHGLLADMGNRNDDHDAERIRALMQRIESESESDSLSIAAPHQSQGRRRFALLTTALTTALTIAAALMVMFFAFGSHQSVSGAMASLERMVEAAAKPLDRTYRIQVVKEYSRDRRPRNLPQEAWNRESPEQIDGATLYVRGVNQYVITVLLKSGIKRTSGCDGRFSWSFRENGSVNVTTNLNRFRGGMPGNQQDMPFINIHESLSQLQIGYDVELTDVHLTVTDSKVLSQLIGVRKSADVRGTKRVEIWFDAENGTVHKMLLDGLPRGRGGPESVMLELIDQSELAADFFSHQSHHEPGRRVKNE